MWKKHWDGDPIRLLGVTAAELEWKTESIKQLDLFSFEEDAKEEPLLAVIDQINHKYGTPMVQRGSQLFRKQEKVFSTAIGK